MSRSMTAVKFFIVESCFALPRSEGGGSLRVYTGADATGVRVRCRVCALASDESTLMTGQTLFLDGGASLTKYPELFRFFGVG